MGRTSSPSRDCGSHAGLTSPRSRGSREPLAWGQESRNLGFELNHASTSCQAYSCGKHLTPFDGIPAFFAVAVDARQSKLTKHEIAFKESFLPFFERFWPGTKPCWAFSYPARAALAKALPLLMLAAWAGVALGAAPVSVEATGRGNAVAIKARAKIRAPYALIWQTLTDYDHLSEFIPGMMTSHVIGRRGSTAIVAQTGEAGFMLFSYPISVVVESREEPPSFIGIRVLKGNLKQLDGGYRIEKTGHRDDEYMLRWSGLIERPPLLPQIIAAPLMRADIADQFRGMVKEIERREALRIGKPVGALGLL